ncbi:MAG TPA: exodeoxyribonuclease VII large subunit [Thiobacillaceae bacterium]|nr:exodeoxyribonuclease VII large subunit [Thiobacillaceae bacterium]HNU65376.1 exodeoxyribonuclease VII large subunit [Thiobacillaceae bacterium]
MPEPPQVIINISALNRMARLALEKNLPSCWVKGEVSNFTRAGSGHWYFTLKDASASARCVMFRVRNQFVDWSVREGEQIELRAQATLYEPRGDFQLVVDAMRKAGLGSLYEAFLRLKDRLELEGLFDATRKRTPPAFPRCIGIITSPQSAALRDVLSTLARRWPLVPVILYACPVQGDSAAGQIKQAIEYANQRQETDILLLIRGGGSLEDLHAFNQEAVARAVAASRIPVISGIGHETDFTITDFVADQRAPTPTGAAQMAVPDRMDWIPRVNGFKQRLHRHQRSQLDSAWQRLDRLARRLRHPSEALRQQRAQVIQLGQRLLRADLQARTAARLALRQLRMRLQRGRPGLAELGSRLQSTHHDLRQAWQHQGTQLRMTWQHLRNQLDLLCPDQVLKRGYSIVRTSSGTVVRAASEVSQGQSLDIQLAAGTLGVRVERQ